MNEMHLVENAINGNKDSFCSLYGMYKDKLFRYAYYRLGNATDAEDAVSNCILSAYQQIGKLKNPKAFSSWLFKILASSCNAVIKEQIEKRNTSDIDDFSNIIVTNLDNAIEKTEIENALSILKDDEKEIVLLSIVAGFNSKEIAKSLDITSSSVRSKLSRSLKKMRDFLEG